jgi:hypothetical protein
MLMEGSMTVTLNFGSARSMLHETSRIDVGSSGGTPCRPLA